MHGIRHVIKAIMFTIIQIKNKSFKNYILYLFSKKGGGNLIWFIKYTIKNCPKRYLLLYMLRGLIGRIVGYWRR